jgi:hypothetical protein
MRNVIYCILPLFLTCMCKSHTYHMDGDRVSDNPHEIALEGFSVHDTIAPPKLITDSTKLYQRLGELLKFSSKLKYEDQTRIAAYCFDVGKDGQVHESNIQNMRGAIASKDIEYEMKEVMDFVLTNLTVWEPAHFRNNPSKKIPYWVDVVFYFYKDKILFLVEGSQSYYFLKKSFPQTYSQGGSKPK